MKRKILNFTACIIAAFMLFSSLTAQGTENKRYVDTLKYPELHKMVLPPILKEKLSNGIRIRLIKDEKLPVVNIRIMIKGGNLYDPSDKIGLSDALSQLVRIGGVKGMTGEEVDKYLDSKGVTIAFNSTNEYYNIDVECLKDNLDASIAILARMLKEPEFNEEKLQEVKTQMSSAISRRNDSPEGIIFREFQRIIYGSDSPFASMQEYANIDNINRDAIVAQYGKFFAADNLVIGVNGAVDMPELVKVIKKYLGTWNTKAQLPAFPQVKELTQDYKLAFINKSNLNQSYLAVGNLGLKFDIAERAKIKVFNSIFSEGFGNRLQTRIRVKMGLTYGAGGNIGMNYNYNGLTIFFTFTKSESTGEALNAMFEEIDRIRKEKVSDAELSDAKNYFLNSYVFKFASPEDILNSALLKEFYGLPENVDERLIEDIKKVTADDVLSIAQKYLVPEKMMIMVLGNESQIKDDLSKFGKVKKIDITIKQPAVSEKIAPATPQSLEKGKQIISSLLETTYKGLKDIKSRQVDLDMKMKRNGMDITMSIVQTDLLPDKSHSEISVMGMKMVRIVNGKKGVNRVMGQEQPISEEEIDAEKSGDIEEMLKSIDDYNFQYLGQETVDGKKYDVIYTTDKKENWTKLFIGTDSHLVEIQEKVSRVPGANGVSRIISSDFKTIDGYPYATNTKIFLNNEQAVEITIKNVVLNPQVDPALFDIEKK